MEPITSGAFDEGVQHFGPTGAQGDASTEADGTKMLDMLNSAPKTEENPGPHGESGLTSGF